MSLSSDLIHEFVKVTDDTPSAKTEKTLYGTIEAVNGSTNWVKIDGSDRLTPCETTAELTAGDRVIVTIKNHTAIVTGNSSSKAVGSKQLSGVSNQVGEFALVLAEKVSTEQLTAEVARIDKLISERVTTEVLNAEVAVISKQLSAHSADIGTLKADNVTIKGTLLAHSADIEDLKVSVLTADAANLTYAKIGDLNAVTGRIGVLETKAASINTLMFGSATGSVIQTSFSNSVIAQLGNAQIKDAMIDSVSADKITAGEIITNNVSILSDNGHLTIEDETMQISDGTRVRVQIGKDAADDFSINVWDQNGNLMFSKGGITDSAIKEAIIRNDMISDTANISASKLDINSLFEEINGSTNTIKSTKIYLDDKAQTLDVAFTALSGDVTTHGTQISAIRGQIVSKIWQQDILKETEALSTKYSSLEQDLDGFKSTVRSTVATKQEVDTAQTTANNADEKASNAQTLIAQLSESISMLVTDGNGTSLMTQTEEGWTFSTATIQSSVNSISESLDSLTTEVGDVESAVEILQQAVNDLGEIAEYVYITTYENEPCIELGETDSEFKLRITNTRMMFSEGSTVLAYFTNQAFNSKKVVIEEELQQGEFVWRVRNNGNLGLTWKGGTS